MKWVVLFVAERSSLRVRGAGFQTMGSVRSAGSVDLWSVIELWPLCCKWSPPI